MDKFNFFFITKMIKHNKIEKKKKLKYQRHNKFISRIENYRVVIFNQLREFLLTYF